MTASFLTKSGELKKRAVGNDTISDMIILGASEDEEEWSPIEVVTLKQHARDQATTIAWNDLSVTPTTADARIDTIARAQFHTLQEFVQVLDDKILIGVNCDTVDDNAIDKAMLMLIDVPDFTAGTYLTFGDKIQVL